jgi:type IV pilus assembly protein PilQ
MRVRHLVISSIAALAMGAGGLVASEASPGENTATTTLTIETSDKPLDTVLQWISRRTGVNVVYNEAEQPRVTLRLVNVTLDEAIGQICAKYDLVIEKTSDRLWVLSRPPKVRMEFQDARLVVVLEALARQANVNIVIGDDIDSSRRLTMTLNGVPWKEALDVIVRTTGYAWIEQQYHIIRVVTPDKLQKDLVTHIRHLDYTRAADVAPVLVAGKSKDGSIVIDPGSNNLIITDTLPALDAIERIIQKVDMRTQEVLIDMKFVDFTDSDADTLGFNPVTLNFNLEKIGQVSLGFSPGNSPASAGGSLSRTSTNIPTATGDISGGLAFEAISSLDSTEILQTPQVLTTDNKLASIIIGREIHFAEETVSNENNAIIRSLKEAASSPVKDGISIEVTPHITTDGYVQIAFKASNDNVTLVTFSDAANANDPNGSIIQLPNKQTTSITANIMVGDGKTGVIGGLLSNTDTETEQKVPLLGSIPVFGWLFKNHSKSIARRNLTIFITPHIIPLNQKSPYELAADALRQDLSNPTRGHVPDSSQAHGADAANQMSGPSSP